MESRFESILTTLADVTLIQRQSHGDTRGFLERMFCAQSLLALGWHEGIAQINHSFTQQSGTVRGMHYQLPPHAERKLVSCIRGRVWDVVLDLRQGSPTFLQYFAAELSDENRMSMMIPPGCAHGFQTLSENVDMLYVHSVSYSPSNEAGVNTLDTKIEIAWPLEITQRSTRDSSFPFLAENFEGVRL